MVFCPGTTTLPDLVVAVPRNNRRWAGPTFTCPRPLNYSTAGRLTAPWSGFPLLAQLSPDQLMCACVGPSQLTACPCCAYTTLHQLAVQAASAGRWVPALGGVLSPWRKVCLAADADTSGGGPVKTGRIQWPGRPEGHRRGWGAGPSSPGTQHGNKLRKICYCWWIAKI